MAYSNHSNKNVSPKTPLSPDEQAILIAVAYSDIFHFPLTEQELWKYLVGTKPISQKAFTTAISTLLRRKQPSLVLQDRYYCLRGSEDVISRRKQNQSEVKAKLLLAHKAVRLLASLPTILFIGLSGGLAVENVSAGDDIDLFIIAKKGTLFRTRLAILFLLQWMGVRRSRGQQQTANTICVNLLIDESELAWSAQKRDLYIAHEIVQIVPLYEQNNVYQSFLDANQWVLQYLPNAWSTKPQPYMHFAKMKGTSKIISRMVTLLPFEGIFRFLQIVVIRRHLTREIVTKSHLAFHPKDYRADSLRQLKLKMRQLGLLTKS